MSSSQRRLPTLPVEAPPTLSPRIARAPLERAAADDLFHDYVLGAYTPLVPAEGKLRGLNVLVESLAVAGVEAEGLEVIRLLREGYGRFRTVWGIKWSRSAGALAWELYFYDFERAHADCSIAGLRALLAPALRVEAEEPYPLPWHMFSIEFTAEDLKAMRPVSAHVYIDMRSYELRGRRFLFENVYTFHDPRAEIDDVLHRIRSSVHVDPAKDSLAELLPPALFRCGKICVANKRTTDALYASRIPTKALRWFLDHHGWPAPIARLVADHAADLDHLLWCVGVDFRRAEGADARKTGLYGSF